jgi:hypothetical protein
MIKTLYYIEVLGCLSPLLTIFQFYHMKLSFIGGGKRKKKTSGIVTILSVACFQYYNKNGHLDSMVV